MTRRPVKILPLPGDAEQVLDDEIRRAIRRDGRLNFEEHTAKATGETCGYCCRQYRSWQCSYRIRPGWMCAYCADLH